MSNVVLFDDEVVLSAHHHDTEETVATPTPLHGYLLAKDHYGRDELCADLAQQGLLLHTQWQDTCAFALVELDARWPQTPFAWPDNIKLGPVVFFGARDCCLQAYQQGGFDFVLQSPAISDELPVRIRHAVEGFAQFHELDQRMRNSQSVAMQAMSLNAELGAILHCLEQCFNCCDIVELSHATFSCLRDMGLSSCMSFYLYRQVNFYSDDDSFRPIDQQVITQTRGSKRIVDHEHCSLYHYEHISVLIRDMPLHDPVRYGILKDHICLLLNGVEARAAAIETQLIAESRARRSGATARVIQDIIVDMDAQKRRFTNHSSDFLETLLLDLRAEFSQLSLSEKEERRLNQLVERTSTRMAELFKDSEDADKTFCHILANLATTLRR